jgi:predicted DNA binding CopG/RHH family protein
MSLRGGGGVRDKKMEALSTDRRRWREYRTEEEFKDAFQNGDLRWSELHRYVAWRNSELKDCIVKIRISGTDLMKLKALARIQGKKYQTYMGEILKQEIHWQEDRLAEGLADGSREVS